MNSRGEYIFTSFDTDDPVFFTQYATREAGRYISRCLIPADWLNEGRYILGMNASTFRVKRYFQDEHALVFNVDGAGAPGKHWVESRVGPLRPKLDWRIFKQ
jgi:lipopolysaccharide transport system ATP-binding protein